MEQHNRLLLIDCGNQVLYILQVAQDMNLGEHLFCFFS